MRISDYTSCFHPLLMSGFLSPLKLASSAGLSPKLLCKEYKTVQQSPSAPSSQAGPLAAWLAELTS